MTALSCSAFHSLKVIEGTLKDADFKGSLPTEWNQIEAAMSLMLKKPTLMVLPKGVTSRGLFEQGAANVFVHRIDTSGPKWVQNMIPTLKALKEKAGSVQP